MPLQLTLRNILSEIAKYSKGYGDLNNVLDPSIIMDDPSRGGIMGTPSPTFPSQPGGSPGSIQMMGSDPSGIDMQRVIGMSDPSAYEPRSQALDAYAAALGEMPDKDNYKPSVLRKIGAAVVGFGSGRPIGMYGGVPVGWAGSPHSAEISQQFLDKPYIEDLSQWKLKTGGLKEAADLESSRNTNERIAANQAASIEIRQAQLERQIERDRQLAEHRNEQTELARERMLRTLPEAESIAMRARYAKELEEFRQGGRKTLQQIDQEFDKAMEGIRQGNRMALAQYVQGQITSRTEYTQDQINQRATDTDTMSPTQQAAARRNKIVEIITAKPEYRDFFELHPTTGQPTGMMTERPTGGIWETEADRTAMSNWDEARKMLESQTPAANTDSPNAANPAPATSETPEQKRARAIKILRDAKKLVNEATIKQVMDGLK